MAFRADSLEIELLLPRPPDFLDMPVADGLAPLLLPFRLTWTPFGSTATEPLAEAVLDFRSLQVSSSSRSFWQFSRSSEISVDIFSISTFSDSCSRLKK